MGILLLSSTADVIHIINRDNPSSTNLNPISTISPFYRDNMLTLNLSGPIFEVPVALESQYHPNEARVKSLDRLGWRRERRQYSMRLMMMNR